MELDLILRNDEICFVIKNNHGESILNPLETYQLRADKKVYAAMFDGTLKDVLPSYDEKKIQNLISMLYLTILFFSAKIRIEKGTTDKRLVQSYIVTKSNRILGRGGYFFV